MDAILEATLRFLFNLFVEVVFRGVFYPFGWVVLKALTLGRYPPAAPATHNRDFVAAFALVPVLIGVTVYFS